MFDTFNDPFVCLLCPWVSFCIVPEATAKGPGIDFTIGCLDIALTRVKQHPHNSQRPSFLGVLSFRSLKKPSFGAGLTHIGHPYLPRRCGLTRCLGALPCGVCPSGCGSPASLALAQVATNLWAVWSWGICWLNMSKLTIWSSDNIWQYTDNIWFVNCYLLWSSIIWLYGGVCWFGSFPGHPDGGPRTSRRADKLTKLGENFIWIELHCILWLRVKYNTGYPWPFNDHSNPQVCGTLVAGQFSGSAYFSGWIGRTTWGFIVKRDLALLVASDVPSCCMIINNPFFGSHQMFFCFSILA